jgi:hypothetical protein
MNHYIKNKNIIATLIERDCDDINIFISDENCFNKLKNIEKIIGKTNWNKKQINSVKKYICDKNSDKIKANILKAAELNMQFNLVDSEYNSNPMFYYDQKLKCYEVQIDESLKNGKAGYGIYYKHNCVYNFYDRVYGDQTLQNTTYQSIEHVLNTFPFNKPLCIILDRKSVFDIMKKVTKLKYKQELDLDYLDVIKRIQDIIKNRTAPITWLHVNSHLNDNNINDNPENLQKKLKKREKMYKLYGETKAEHLIEGNSQADKLANKALELSDLKRPEFTKEHNLFVLKSIRKKSSHISDFKGFHNSRIRKNLKKQQRIEYATKLFKEKSEKYDWWVDNPVISKLSCEIIKNPQYKYHNEKKFMIRMIHQTLPTCEKMYRHI